MNGSESLQNHQSAATENALRRAVDTTPAFIHTARPDGYLDYFNRGWLDFLGKSLEDVCGWGWTESIHPEDVAAIVQKWHAALATGEPFEMEARVRCADGSYRAFLQRKVPLRDEHGNIAKWFGSSVDSLPHRPGPAWGKQTRMAFAPKMNIYMHMLAQINPTVLPALRIAATFFFIINLLGGAYIFRNRHRFFDRDPNVDNDIPAVRKVRIEVVAIPWLVLTTLILILLISFWLA